MIETVHRSCPTCEASCGLVLSVDREKNKVISIKGDPADPRSKGYVCAKSQAFNYVYEDPDRLRAPVKKVAGGWEEISWEEAIELVGRRIREAREQYGKDSLAIYYGEPNGHNAGTNLYTQLFTTMLDTERFFSPGTIDQQPKQVSSQLLYGDEWFFPVPDIDRTDLFICMGGNPVVSQGSMMGAPDVKGRLKAIIQRGGYSVVIDPRHTETAKICDEHLFIRPGTDSYFLLAFLHEVFDKDWVKLGHLAPMLEGLEDLAELVKNYSPESVADITGVDPDVLRKLVERFCTTERAVLYGRIGLCTQRFGTIASWLVDVVNIVTGHFDREGGLMFSRPAHGQIEASDSVTELARDRYVTRATGFPEKCGQLPASHLGRELDYQGEDKVRVMMTLAGNPVISVPNGKLIRTGLEKVDFYVAIDIYINETTSQADVILPPLHQLEHSNYDLLWSSFASRNFAAYSPAVLSPKRGGKEQWEIMLRILGEIFGTPWEALDDLMADGLAERVASGLKEQWPDIHADEVRASLGEERGYERYLDAMLQAGPYGACFGRVPDGLSLNSLKSAGGVIDYGPLKPRLPGILRTRGKKLRLVHDYILDDFARLNAVLEQGICSTGKLLLIGRRQIRDMNSWLHNIYAYVRGKARCTLLVNPTDAEVIGLESGSMVKVTSRTGEVAVNAEISDEVMPGVVSLPHGWGHRYTDGRQAVVAAHAPGASANDLVDDEVLDLPSGTSVVNGVEVSLSLI